ncbi:hypothetical protein B0H13DRAFT_2349059 [Mycena leptocephala]|nr:hypothetical protein B0H13DRAFT_2349059 [Mycena leptocephala]
MSQARILLCEANQESTFDKLLEGNLYQGPIAILLAPALRLRLCVVAKLPPALLPIRPHIRIPVRIAGAASIAVRMLLSRACRSAPSSRWNINMWDSRTLRAASPACGHT